MTKRIITISREFGSGGRFIGEEVAKKLGIAYYDKDIIGQIAEQSGLSPKYIQENAELSPKKGMFAYAFTGRDITGKSIEDIVYEAQRKVILEIAEKESCVIIGRNADFILKIDAGFTISISLSTCSFPGFTHPAGISSVHLFYIICSIRIMLRSRQAVHNLQLPRSGLQVQHHP